MIPEYLYVNSGDELRFNVKLVINGKPYKLRRGEKVWFDVKKYTYDTSEETPVLIHVEQLDTKIYIPRVDLEPGDYIFDIGVIHADGTTKTIIPCIRNSVNKLVVGKRVYDPSMLRMSINIDDTRAVLSRFSDAPGGASVEEEIRELFDITTELTDDYRKTFIVVQTMSELSNLPKENLVNGKIVKVVDSNGSGKAAYYSFNYSTQTFEKFTFSSDPRAFITVDTANDLISIPQSELVHGKIVRVNRPKSNDNDNIPDIVEDPKDYYKPTYYSYDSIGNQWVLVNFGNDSSATEQAIIDAINKHNSNDTSHQDIRDELKLTTISVDTVEDMKNISSDNLVDGKLIRVSKDEDGKPKYYVWNETSKEFVVENFSSYIENIQIDSVEGLSDVISWSDIDSGEEI